MTLDLATTHYIVQVILNTVQSGVSTGVPHATISIIK